MKAKKLPNILVRFLAGKPQDLLGRPTIGRAHPSETFHRYTPAKPAKVCVWVGIGMGAYRVGCQRSTLRISSGAYCPDCGGKIKVAR